LAHCEPSRSNASFAGELRFAGCEGVDGHVLVLCRSRGPDESKDSSGPNGASDQVGTALVGMTAL
jgi:hypothetical protein